MAIHPWQRDIWRRLVANRQAMPHALLLQGRKGVGKLDFAHALARGLLCQDPQADGEACGRCQACGWMAQGNHPDFRIVDPDARNEGEEGGEAKSNDAKGKKASRQIRIEQVRELESLVNLSTHRNGMRVIVIHPAEAMNQSAANALLKTLEEPPPQSLFILVTHHPQHLLPTVRSRCRKLAFPVPPEEESLAWLRAQNVAEPGLLLAQAGFAPLAALELAAEGAQEGRKDFLSQLCRPRQMDPIALAEKSDKLDVPSAVRWLQQWVYDLIGCRLAGQVRYQVDYKNEINELSRVMNVNNAIRYQKELLATQKNVHHPLNAQLLLEQLLLSYMQLMNSSESGHG